MRIICHVIIACKKLVKSSGFMVKYNTALKNDKLLDGLHLALPRVLLRNLKQLQGYSGFSSHSKEGSARWYKELVFNSKTLLQLELPQTKENNPWNFYLKNFDLLIIMMTPLLWMTHYKITIKFLTYNTGDFNTMINKLEFMCTNKATSTLTMSQFNPIKSKWLSISMGNQRVRISKHLFDEIIVTL